MSQTKTQIISVEGLNSSIGTTKGYITSEAWNGTTELQRAMDILPQWTSIIIIKS